LENSAWLLTQQASLDLAIRSHQQTLTGVENGIKVHSRLLKKSLTQIDNQEVSISRTLSGFETLRPQLGALLSLQESLDK